MSGINSIVGLNKVDLEGWLEAQETPIETDAIPVEQMNGNVVYVGSKDVTPRVNKARCPSYFTRDGLDKLFA